MNVAGKRALVVGLARSGLAVARALARRGAVVMVSDRKPPAEFHDLLPQLIKEKIGVELGMQREETFLRHDLIVISPGVPWDLPQLQAARARNIPIYPEVEAATWFLEGTLVGITGTNGKTTTTSLLGDMLKASGFPTFVGGNIGKPLSAAVDSASPGTTFVTELSSFQLEGIHDFRPQVAVMLNLSPNHLDRHPNLEAYANAKRQIFRNQRAQDYAVLNADDPWVAGLAATVPGQPVFFSQRRELPDGIFASGSKIYYRVRHLERVLFETSDVRLKGDFNLEDVLAATTAACLLGADFAAIRKAVRDFKAVEHRLEFVREIRGVDFYNNSKATSVDATLKSLEAFDRGVHLILGGKDKGAPYTPLISLIKERVREVLLIGAAAPIIAQQLAGVTQLVDAGDLATAVHQAFACAPAGDTVLLAPACSSFDQFQDYEERGRVFKEIVNGIRDTGYGRRDGKAGIRDTGLGIRDEKAGIQDSGYGTRDSQPIPETPKDSGSETQASTNGAAEGALECGSSSYRFGPDASETLPPASAPQSAEVASEGSENESVNVVPAGVDPDQRDSSAAAPQKSSERDMGYGIRGEGGTSLDLEVGTRDLGEAAQPHETNVPESLTPKRETRDTGPGTETSMPESLETGPPSRELKYIYETDAEELPPTESQVIPDDEPAIVMGEKVELLEDEILPFEVRPNKSEVRGPASEENRSEVRSPKSGVQERQPGLFEENN